MPDVSIITVNFYTAPALVEAQRTLALKPPTRDFEWIVVNHSDERVAPVPALASRLRVITEPNLGFAAGVNAAARAAASPVLFLANPDLEFNGALIDAGLARLAEWEDVGVVGPQLVGLDGEPQRTARRFYTWPDVLFARVPGRDRLRPPGFWRRHLMVDDDLSRPADVDWILGAALFVRRSALRDPAHGVFDPRYFLYFEDVDLCMDLWSRGWRVRYDPLLRARHGHARASSELGSRAWLMHAASFAKFVRKWNGLRPRPRPAEVPAGAAENARPAQ